MLLVLTYTNLDYPLIHCFIKIALLQMKTFCQEQMLTVLNIVQLYEVQYLSSALCADFLIPHQRGSWPDQAMVKLTR